MEDQNKELTNENTKVATADDAASETEEPSKHIKQTFDRQLNQIRDIISLSLNDQTLRQYAGEFGYSIVNQGTDESIFPFPLSPMSRKIKALEESFSCLRCHYLAQYRCYTL